MKTLKGKSELKVITKSFFIAASIALPLALIIIYLFTRPTMFSSLDLSDTGQIGDTIGGITAPLFNLLAAVLIYTSFKEQVKANKEQNKAKIIEAELAHVDSLMRQIDDELKSLSVEISEFSADGNTKLNIRKYSGAEAFNRLTSYLLNDYDNPESRKAVNQDFNSINDINLQAHYMLSSLTLIIRNIKNKPSLEKELLSHRLKGYYLIKLKTGFNNLVRYQKNNIENTSPVVSENFIKAYEDVNTFFESINYDSYYQTA